MEDISGTPPVSSTTHTTTVSINEGNSEVYRCSMCSKWFSQRTSLKTHMNLYPVQIGYECRVCSRIFIRSNYELKCHTGENNYECSVCNKRFSQIHCLRTHMVIHSGEKKFECSFCSERLKLEGNFKGHKFSYTGERKHKFIICSKRFTQKDSLKTHMLIHFQDKKYECSFCCKRFSRKDQLRTHLAIHSGQKYERSICSISFSLYSTANSPVTLLERRKVRVIFNCNVCHEKFDKGDSFKKHMELHKHFYQEARSFETAVRNEKYKSSFEKVKIPLRIKKENAEWNASDVNETFSDEFHIKDDDLASSMKIEIEDVKIEEDYDLESCV